MKRDDARGEAADLKALLVGAEKLCRRIGGCGANQENMLGLAHSSIVAAIDKLDIFVQLRSEMK